MRVALLTDAATDVHRSPGHPERPERRAAVVDGIRDAAETAGAGLSLPLVEEASDEEITAVHDASYLQLLTDAEAAGGGWLDPDTYLVRGSVRAARLAAGGTIGAAQTVAAGEADVAFAVVRPPGHHAGRERGTGFCLFNNAAVAVETLRRSTAVRRVAIVDWDVHHGDGTQATYEAEGDVLYASTHQWPFYPGTGARDERGRGAATGTTFNAPLGAGAGDAELLEAWRGELLPAIEAFRPDAILVSAGYDAHRDDPLAHLRVTAEGYGALAAEVGALAGRLDLPGVALTLEGGYDLAALRASAATTVLGLIDGLGRGKRR